MSAAADPGYVVINGRRYPSHYPPGSGHWAIDEAWQILDRIKDGVIPDDARAFLSGLIAGTLMRECSGVAELKIALGASAHALRSYQYGNAATDLAKSTADHIEGLLAKEKGDDETDCNPW